MDPLSAVDDGTLVEVAPPASKPDSDAAEIIARLESESQHRNPRVRSALLIGWAAATAMVIITFLASDMRDALQGSIIITILSLLGWRIGGLVASANQKRAVRHLAQIDSVAAVPYLVDALGWPERCLRAPISRALARLLPRISTADSATLTRRRLAILRHALGGCDHELTISILAALDRIGDTESIPAVRRLLRHALLSDSDVRMRVAAQDCVTSLEKRVARGDDSLLRPAYSDDAPSATLLRPAAAGKPSEAHALLRPAAPQ